MFKIVLATVFCICLSSLLVSSAAIESPEELSAANNSSLTRNKRNLCKLKLYARLKPLKTSLTTCFPFQIGLIRTHTDITHTNTTTGTTYTTLTSPYPHAQVHTLAHQLAQEFAVFGRAQALADATRALMVCFDLFFFLLVFFFSVKQNETLFQSVMYAA